MITGSLQTKRDKSYVVISYKDDNKKWKQKWLPTELTAKEAVKLGKKKKEEVEKKYIEIFKKQQEEIERKEIETQNTDTQILENYRNMPFLKFIEESLKEFKSQVEETTYDNWCNIYNGRITNFFTPIKELEEKGEVLNKEVKRKIYYTEQLTISQVSHLHFQFFNDWLYDCDLKGATVDKYYTFFTKLMKRAVRLHIIKKSENPMDEIEKPKIAPFIGQFYSPQEINVLLGIAKGSVLEVPISLATTYGLRRSEIIGLKWDAIDFENKCIIIRHTVTKVRGTGENQIISCKNLTKTTSGYGAMPLTQEIEELLLKHKRKIEENKNILKNQYIKQTQDYICVNEIGELLKPDRLTQGFKRLLREHKEEIKEIRLHDLRHTVRKPVSIEER